MSMDFELKLDGKTMSRFLLHYNYTKATGLFGILLGIASLAAVFIKWNTVSYTHLTLPTTSRV